MKYKKCIFVFFIFLIPYLVFSKDITFSYVMNNGKEYKRRIDENASILVLELKMKGIKEIKGLEQLKNVKELSLYNLDISSFDFLSSFSTLEHITFNNVPFSSFTPLMNNKSLKTVSILGGVTKEVASVINEGKEIDLTSFKELKEITLKSEDVTKVPHFFISSDNFILDIQDTAILKLDDDDVDVLREYKNVFLAPSFLYKSPKDLQRLRGENISYDTRRREK